MKIGLIFTGMTKELVASVESAVCRTLGKDTVFLSWQDASILEDIRKAGCVTVDASAKLVSLYLEAAKAGVDAMLNVCSTVGEVADATASLGAYLQVPIVRIDADMCRAAVRDNNRIAIVATLPTTMAPTKRMVLRAAQEQKKTALLQEILVENAFGADPEQFWNAVLRTVGSAKEGWDAMILAQASMAYCAQALQDHFQKPVFTSPPFGALALRKALEKADTILSE